MNFLEQRVITRNKEGNFLLITRSIHKKDIIILNMYVPRTLKQRKVIDMQ